MLRRGIHYGIVLLAAVTCSSCGKPSLFKPTYRVEGQLFYNGKPAAGAKVFLKPLGASDDPLVRPMAIVDSDGRFILATYRKDDGAPAGSYGISFLWLPNGYHGPIESANRLPARYASVETSGITAEVEAADNVWPPFQLAK